MARAGGFIVLDCHNGPGQLFQPGGLDDNIDGLLFQMGREHEPEIRVPGIPAATKAILPDYLIPLAQDFAGVAKVGQTRAIRTLVNTPGWSLGPSGQQNR